MKIRRIGNLYFACANFNNISVIGKGATIEEAFKNFNTKIKGGVRVCQ